MEEVWTDVAGFEDLYIVSNLGNIKSIRRNRLLTPRKHTGGYRTVCLSVNNKHTYKYIHRLVAEAFDSTYTDDCIVNHLDADKTNNVLYNLECGTQNDNIQHSVQNRLNVYGERSHLSKLSNAEAQFIKYSDRSLYDLSERFGVSKATVSRIKNNLIWKHL